MTPQPSELRKLPPHRGAEVRVAIEGDAPCHRA